MPALRPLPHLALPLTALCAALLAACGSGVGARPEPASARACSPLVVLVSLDGFRPDYVDRAPTPTFARLRAEGAHAARLIPPDPSLTFPGHATLATGASPARHGILANTFFDRVRGRFSYRDEVSWYGVDPLWIHALRHGRRAHVFHWVGSAGPRDGLEPVWRAFDKAVTDDDKVAQILDWARAPAAGRAELIMSYFAGCDHVGHERGPDSADVTACVAETDARLGRLLAGLGGLDRPATLVVVSDHGMVPTVGEVNPEAGLRAAGVKAQVVLSGPVAHVYLEDASPAGLAAATAAAEALPHLTVTRPTGADRHPDRTGDLVLRAESGWHFNRKLPDHEAPAGHRPLPGHHGGDPEHPLVAAIFYAHGAGVRAGAQVPRARAHDVAPTVAHLLGLPPLPAAEGAALLPLLDPGACAPAAGHSELAAPNP